MKTPDEIKKGLECCNTFNDCQECHYDKADGSWACTVERNADALAYIKQLEAQMPRWISVEERLPEDGQRVVAICENGMTGIMDYKDDGTPFAARILGHYFSNITYWYPLPEPPKEDTHEDHD